MLDLSESVGSRETPETLTVGELMTTGVHTARTNDTIEEAHKFMRMAGVRHLPVLNEDDEMIGILSDRDLLLGWAHGASTPIIEVMTRYTKWVHPQTTARDAAAMILSDKIGCLPVLDDKRKLIGIVTETDFLLVAHRALTLLGMLKTA